jgi:hypothetical protein
MMLLKSAISRILMACLSSVDLPQLESPTMTGRTKIDVGNRRDVSRPEAGRVFGPTYECRRLEKLST